MKMKEDGRRKQAHEHLLLSRRHASSKRYNIQYLSSTYPAILLWLASTTYHGNRTTYSSTFTTALYLERDTYHKTPSIYLYELQYPVLTINNQTKYTFQHGHIPETRAIRSILFKRKVHVILSEATDLLKIR